jgi:AP-1-like factor
LQACPKVKEGEFDLDLLCKDLQKKAKCSETGAVVNESDFNQIMKSHIDKNGSAKADMATKPNMA